MTKGKRAVLYVRISKSSDESVSIERQLAAARKYAEARGWAVVGEFVDDGVSATRVKPEDRAGWRALLAERAAYDAVIVWKVDRLARRVIDFLKADEALRERGAAAVSVTEPIDMTTAQGRAFATMLAVFAEMEAEAIRARVTGARAHLLASGRYAGGRPPYGWKAVDNPSGPGKVLVQDPEQIEWVRGMVARTLEGRALYSTVAWLNGAGAPTATGGRGSWRHNTVRGILTNPLVAGLVLENPGHKSKARGPGVVRGKDGLPKVHEHLAVMPLGQWRAMVAGIEDQSAGGARTPVRLRSKTDPLLSALVWCGDARHARPVRMYRGTHGSTGGRTSYSCPKCRQTLTGVEGLVVSAMLDRLGDMPHLDVVEEVVDGGAAELAEINLRINELGASLAGTDDVSGVLAEIAELKERQAEAAARPGRVEYRPLHGEFRTYGEDWSAAEGDVERQRVILGHALKRIVVQRGGRGKWTDASKLARMTFEWRERADDQPSDEFLASTAV